MMLPSAFAWGAFGRMNVVNPRTGFIAFGCTIKAAAVGGGLECHVPGLKTFYLPLADVADTRFTFIDQEEEK